MYNNNTHTCTTYISYIFIFVTANKGLYKYNTVKPRQSIHLEVVHFQLHFQVVPHCYFFLFLMDDNNCLGL